MADHDDKATLTVAYPPNGTVMTPTVVPGGGGFCLWGKAASTTVDSATASWSGPSPGSVAGVRISNTLTPNTFGFAFYGVDPTLMQIVTIAVKGSNATNNVTNLKMGPG